MSRRNGLRTRGVAAILAVSVLAGGCGRPDPTSAGPSSGPSGFPSPTASSTAPRGELGATFQSGPFLLTVGEVTDDRAAHRLSVAIRFENLGDSWQSPPGDGVLLLGDRELPMLPVEPPARVPPGLSTDVTLQVDVQDGDPTRDGIVRWGRADETQHTVRLADGAVDGFGTPRDIDLDAWGQIGREAIHLTHAVVFADAVSAPRAPIGEHVLRLVFDEYSSSSSVINGFVPADQLTLERPDGAIVDALSGSAGRTAPSWTASTGNHADFPVPAEPWGTYRVLLASVSRTAMGTLHPELIQRIPIAIALEEAAATARTSPPGDPPRAHIAMPAAGGPPSPVDIALTTGEVNIPGFGFRATHLHWDPASATATIDGEVDLVDPIVSPDTGVLAVPSTFQPLVSLRTRGRLHDGLLPAALPGLAPGAAPMTVQYQFPFVTELDPTDATLVIGNDSMAPSILPLTPGSGATADPPMPARGSITAPPVTAGNYTIQLTGYRFGLPRDVDRPPAGMRMLEVVLDVSAHKVENTGAFGLVFNPATQLFIASRDGYLQQSTSSDTAYLEDGGSATIAATFQVPVTWTPGTLAFTVRSRDEIRDITADHWVEVTFPAVFGPHDGGANGGGDA